MRSCPGAICSTRASLDPALLRIPSSSPIGRPDPLIAGGSSAVCARFRFPSPSRAGADASSAVARELTTQARGWFSASWWIREGAAAVPVLAEPGSSATTWLAA